MCCEEDQGVDINRNYDWDFGGAGSSKIPYAQDYPGPYAFSELETQAMKRFMDEHYKEIRLAYNFHAYGNIYLHPFSSDFTKGIQMLETNFP